MLMANRQAMGEPVRSRAARDRPILPTTHQPREDASSSDETNRLDAPAQAHRPCPARCLDRGRTIDVHRVLRRCHLSVAFDLRWGVA